MDTPIPTGPAPETSDAAALRAAVEQGLAEAGRTVPYDAMRAWVLSWGTGQEGPPPACPSG